MFVTIIGAIVLALFQVVIILLDNFLPHFMPCDILVYMCLSLHPLVTFGGSYVLLFSRQYFTLETLRQTPLKSFIPLMATTISAMSSVLIFVFCIASALYLIICDRKKTVDSTKWVVVNITNYNVTGTGCLVNAEVDVILVVIIATGNLLTILLCSLWETIPFVRYVWYRYSCSLPKVHKYLEILAFKIIAGMMNILIAIPTIPAMIFYKNLVAFTILSWLLYISILTV